MLKRKKRILAIIMALVMIIGVVPVQAFASAGEPVPFSVTVGGTEMTDITEGTLTWTDWSGVTSDVICYTVKVPANAGEATLIFEEKKQWSYYDSRGNYVGAGDSSWTASTEHTVAIQDSNDDGELDGISVQNPNAYSTDFYILFVYAGEEEPTPDEPEHVHTYDNGVETTKPTCVDEGVKTYTCSGCEEGTEGHSYTEPIAATGHSYNEGEVTTEPTCTEKGEKTYTCSVCTEDTEGHTKLEPIAATGHSYNEGELTTEPTCTREGVKTYTCSVCTEETVGHTKTEAVPVAKHAYGDDGFCAVCGIDENGIYQIGTAEKLLWFAKEVNSGNTTFKGMLTADIDLSKVEDWPGIGNESNGFNGSFDGQNYTIKLNGSTFGVFGYVKGTSDTYVQIKNIITEGTVKNTAMIHSAVYVTVENCVNRAEVGGNGDNSNVAGIVGNTGMFKRDCVIIKQCANEGNITGNSYVAGIIGRSDNSNAIITNTYNRGEIVGKSNVGGIVGCLKGYPGESRIENCYNAGNISGNDTTGGLAGYLYNNVNITNCYNAGEVDYAIAGGIYNNTVKITNTYYRGSLCTYSVPDQTSNTGTYTGNRGISKNSAEMSGEEIVNLLGDAFKQSCPSPVLVRQDATGHTMEDNICVVCKAGNIKPEEYVVTHVVPEGTEVVGDTSYRAGNDYTFSVTVNDGYYKNDTFSVSVDGDPVEAVDGVYTVENPNGPFYVTVTGVEKYDEILVITLPREGYGYRVNPCEGYGRTVKSGEDYEFTVSFVDGFKAGKDFAVKVNDENVTADEHGIYTIENIMLNQKITVEGVETVPSDDTATIKLDFTKGKYNFLQPEKTDEIMMGKEVELPYFDIALYGLERYYYNPYCYVDENGNINGQQKVGTPESAYGVVTSMHAFIYMTEVYYLGYDEKDAGKGYSMAADADDDGVSDFDEAVSWTQNVGSTFMDLWGLGTNLNYHINYEYPVAVPEWGSTSDQQALKDGDLLSVHMITGNASGSAFGLFVVNDENGVYDRTDDRDSATVAQGEALKLTHYLAVQGEKYTTAFETAPSMNLYWVEEGDESADITEWNRAAFGSMDVAAFKTDENGVITIDTTEVEPGTYYIGAVGVDEKGNGTAGSDGFVSRGSEAGPSYFKLVVEEAEEPEVPDTPEVNPPKDETPKDEPSKEEAPKDEPSKDETPKDETSKEEVSAEVEKLGEALGLTEKGANAVLTYAKKNNISMDTLLVTGDSIKAQNTEENPYATYGKLLARATKTTNKKITLKWKKVKGADGYIVYGNKCGIKNKFEQIKVLKASKTTFTQKKLKKGTYYKYMVVAYKLVDGKKVTISVSKTIHAATTGGKYGNAKAVKVNKTKVTAKVGNTVKVKASQVKKEKKIKNHRKLAFESSNTKIATVNKNGKIKGIKKGSCYIYVYAQNGLYKRVKVTVK